MNTVWVLIDHGRYGGCFASADRAKLCHANRYKYTGVVPAWHQCEDSSAWFLDHCGLGDATIMQVEVVE